MAFTSARFKSSDSLKNVEANRAVLQKDSADRPSSISRKGSDRAPQRMTFSCAA